MSTTVKVQIQQRIDTASNWASANPTPLSGEICWNSDDKKYKIGDGSTAWASLAYAPGSGGYTAGTGVSISGSNVISASAVALTTVQTAANQTAHLALTTQEGDVVVRSDEIKSYVRNSGSAGSMADFSLLATPTDAVISVNGYTGPITAAQLAAAIEAASDSNTFTDADHTKLNGIAASANNYAISSDLLDEDDFATNSATKVASQQSIKAYVDANSSSVIDEDNFASNSATVAPSQQSVKAYVDTADALKANLSGATFTGDVVFTGDAANVTWDKSTDDLIFNDNAKAIFGTNSDGVEIYHDASHSYIQNTGTGYLILAAGRIYLTNAAGNENLALFTADGSSELNFDGSSRISTTASGADINGHLTMSSNHNIKLGNSAALQFYHSTSHGFIDNSVGVLHVCGDDVRIKGTGDSETLAKFVKNAQAELYFDNSLKLSSITDGIRIHGKITMSNGDFVINHDGFNGYITNKVGTLYIKPKSGNDGLVTVPDGTTKIYWDGSKKLETTNSGVTVTGSVTETSDVSLKNDINTIQNPLELIEQIRGINFTWKNNGTKSMGVIAQDVEKVFPELVHGTEGSKSLQYSGLIGALVESVKELSAKVSKLENA